MVSTTLRYAQKRSIINSYEDFEEKYQNSRKGLKVPAFLSIESPSVGVHFAHEQVSISAYFHDPYQKLICHHFEQLHFGRTKIVEYASVGRVAEKIIRTESRSVRFSTLEQV